MRNHDNGWCILRTAGRSTLPLASSLMADGIESWTPAELKRYPGKKAKRPVPILPTFVFARSDNLWPLVELSEDPTWRGDGFSVMLDPVVSGYPLIADEDLEPLRREERRAEWRGVPKEELPAFSPGDEVKVVDPDSTYCGKMGTILRSKGRTALVLFGWQRVKISTFILKPNGVISAGQAHQRTAA